MRVQKKVSIQGEWAKKKEDILNGDIITINNSGQLVSGEYGERYVFKVETRNGEKLLTFNQTSINYLIDGYGDNTDNWVGKRAKVWIIKANVGGKLKDVVYLTPPDWIEGDDGFYPPNSDTKVIDVDDIPIEDEGV